MRQQHQQKHIISPEKQLGVQKKQYRNGYKLLTYIHENGCTYKFITVSVLVTYSFVCLTLYDVAPIYQSTREVQKMDFWNF